ncbi:MAG: tRNA (adenosine(37)-N6)-dimethylallyltransferase MiaA [Hydrogenophaga sp.]|uniref:tRNA (adenosine(37)-N6)-dimethylallyltransferase MiaA n=1 Tax=Hydrogenophaga sp. TaxID=1904254 RepID=UPI0027168EE0|nr:tRNA (adenosine(37)-N6)-dimethylallyltransferase MiaA [Hydrogenophaga sp.]MDO9505295.1 tRNA (adenosine(37)-N6)-dimethylallyltransferase MiaA [Hydrogenophaga sp.]MDP2986652.1 tRNA (adenosine(37)-N6)-dimethylallyltransferase MiaA [Hydrogenophaga sp.]MDP3204299.1 tRNA (adenosine(37)-N6)-dimethylallyltransferase MiaA [Hydrogenophaga sp.]MDP3626772.1 tRNA (adenosine(37)-N6)-dimethylallyltransferase MiaA [Hydrogenophaga sp.]
MALVSCIGLAGPTASGKSAASLAIAQRWPVEIISVDSALVYRGMDIGTAKPTAAELAQVPHHLINILDPLQSYSAADFVRDTTRLVGEINGRRRTALLVGGTMLYFKALLVGLDDMPQADAAVRASIDARAAALGWPALHDELQRVDPVTAARLPPFDSQRIQRALEVFEVSGRPLSSFQTGRTHNPDSPLAPEHLFSLEPQDRAWLHARIAQRFDAMLAEGFMIEVKRLRARGDLSTDLPSMRCVGYRQAWDLLDAYGNTLKPAQVAELRELGVAATRQLAKRQLTWLRSMPQRRVIACDAPDALACVLESVQALLGAPT